MIGIIICFIGAYLIVSSERKPTYINEKTNNDESSNVRNLLEIFFILYGAIAVLCHLAIPAFANFAQRELRKEGIARDEQNFWLGVFNCIPSFIVMLIQGNLGLGNIKYPLYTMTNAPVFYLANYTTAEALKI